MNKKHDTLGFRPADILTSLSPEVTSHSFSPEDNTPAGTKFREDAQAEQNKRLDNEKALLAVAQVIAQKKLELAESELKIVAQNHTLQQLTHLLQGIDAKRALLSGVEQDLQRCKANIMVLQTDQALLNEVAQQVAVEISDELVLRQQQLQAEHNHVTHAIQQQLVDETNRYEAACETLSRLDSEKARLISSMNSRAFAADKAEDALAAERALLDQTFFLDLNVDMLSQCLTFTTSPLLRVGMHWRFAFIEIDRGNIVAARFDLQTVLKSHFPAYKHIAQQKLKQINKDYPPETRHKLAQKAKKASKKVEVIHNCDKQIQTCMAIKSAAHSTSMSMHLAMLELVALYAQQQRADQMKSELEVLNASSADVELKAWGFFLCGEYWRNCNIHETAATCYQQALELSPSFTEARYCFSILKPHQATLKASENPTLFFTSNDKLVTPKHECHLERREVRNPGYPS